MKPRQMTGCVRPTAESQAAFTITDLLMLVAVLAVIFCLQVSAMTVARDQTRAAQCSANLRQFTLAATSYAYENNNRLPNLAGLGVWAWDLAVSATDSLAANGASRNNLYCPANPDQNVDGLWNWNPAPPYGYRVIGYATTFAGNPALMGTNQNASILPAPVPFGPVTYPAPRASERVLLADASLTEFGQNAPPLASQYQWTRIQGGYIASHRSAHLNGLVPAGCNVSMLDGHVEWRSFAQMIPRTAPSSSSPPFWW